MKRISPPTGVYASPTATPGDSVRVSTSRTYFSGTSISRTIAASTMYVLVLVLDLLLDLDLDSLGDLDLLALVFLLFALVLDASGVESPSAATWAATPRQTAPICRSSSRTPASRV